MVSVGTHQGTLRVPYRRAAQPAFPRGAWERCNSEREISIAIGITMVQYRLDRKAAFNLLRKTARSQNRKLAELAADVIKASETLNL